MKKDLLFKSFVNLLNRTQVEYCILGNVESYFREINSDIDFFVPASILKNTHSIVVNFALQNNLNLVRINKYAAGGISFVLAFAENRNIKTISFDFCTNYNKAFRTLISENEIRHHIVYDKINECYRLDKFLSFKYYNIKKLCKGSAELNQFQYLQSLYDSLSGAEKTIIADDLHCEKSNKFLYQNSYAEYLQNINSCRNKLFRSTPISVSVIKNEMTRIINRIRNPEGRIIEIDKTAFEHDNHQIVDRVINNLKGIYKNEIIYIIKQGQQNKSRFSYRLKEFRLVISKIYPDIIKGSLIITPIALSIIRGSSIIFKIHSYETTDAFQESLLFISKMHERNIKSQNTR